MRLQPHRTFLIIITLIAFTANLLIPASVVRADDTLPPTPTEESVVTEEGGELIEENVTISEPDADTPTEPASEPTSEVNTPAEILASAPEGVDVVVLDESGESVPLVTQEAAQIILEGDPMWCPDGATPGNDPGNLCTPSYLSFSDLITDLTNGGYTGNGTIYVAYNYSDGEGNITLDHTSGSLSALGNLTIQGGWDFSNDTILNNDPTTQSNLGNNALSIINWVGNVTVNNIFISGASPNSDSLGGLYVQTAGDVALNYVTVNNTQNTDTTGENGTGIYIANGGNVNINEVAASENDNHGLYITTGSNVEISNTKLNQNGFGVYSNGPTSQSYGDGLQVWGQGDITLNDVFAQYNAGNGASLFVDGSANILNSLFEDNGQEISWYSSNIPGPFSPYEEYYSMETFGGYGLYLSAAGSVFIEGSGFYNNSYDGANISTDEDLEIVDSVFNGNGYWGNLQISTRYDNDAAYYNEFQMDYEAGSGLYAEAEGDITLTDVLALSNSNSGIYLYSELGDILISNTDVTGNGFGGTFFDGGPGYDYLDEYLLAINSGGTVYSFCDYVDDAGIGYQALIFDPCADSGYIDVQGAEFSYNVALQDSDGTGPLHSNYYGIMQSGGAGLDVEAESGSITLNSVGAYANAGDGAYLNADQNVFVTDSSFMDNGEAGYLSVGESSDTFTDHSGLSAGLFFSYGSGLDAQGENVTLNSVVANGNYHHGAILESGNTLSIETGEFISNGMPINIGGPGGLFEGFLNDEFGLSTSLTVPSSSLRFEVSLYSDAFSDALDLYLETTAGSGLYTDANGNTTLNNVLAADNLGYGADLYTNNDMSISNSGFYANGDGIDLSLYAYANNDAESINIHVETGSGLYAGAGNNVTLANVGANGNALYGAMLEGENVTVSDGSFNSNGNNSLHVHYNYFDDGTTQTDAYSEYFGSGLYIDAQGGITLNYVNANGNYLDGAELYSNGGPITVLCGMYNANGAYGIYAEGASSLGLYGPEILGNGNSPDEYFFSGATTVSEECVLPVPAPVIGGGSGGGQKGPLPINIIPVGGKLNCTEYSGTLFTLPNGDRALYPCPISDEGNLKTTALESLPSLLPEGSSFLSAFEAQLFTDGVAQTTSGRPITVSFIIPEGADKEDLAILFWDGNAWTELTNARVSEDGLYFEGFTNKLGTFVLVSR